MKKTKKAPEGLARKTIQVTEYLWRDVKLCALRDNLSLNEFIQKALWREVHRGAGDGDL